MIFKNGIIFSGGEFARKDVLVRDGVVAALRNSPVEHKEVDLGGNYLLPGLIDVHTHGVLGSDFASCTECDLKKMEEFYISHGTTSFLPTIISSKKDAYISIFNTIKKSAKNGGIVGINLEGPFFGATRPGAQNRYNLLPIDESFMSELISCAPYPIKIVAIDPTLDGTDSFVRRFSAQTTIALGHTNVTNARAKEAFALGASHVTHLFNAMSPLHHREPGLVGAALVGAATCELICDGVHLHPDIVKIAFEILGERAVLVSDSMAGTGMPDGIYELGGQQVTLKNGRATLADATIAGSSVTLFECVKQAIAMGISPAQAILSATAVPARLIGKSGQIGEICIGAAADFLVVSKSWELLGVYKNGICHTPD